jgi:GntR family transcriptional regulator
VNQNDDRFGNDAQPRYAQLSEMLRERIVQGVYPVGAFLPTEAELCASFGISRHTVREALRRLSEAGYLRRRQGSGSEVISAQPQQQYVHAMRSLDGLFQYATDTSFRIDSMDMEVPGPEHAEDLQGAAAQPWLVLRGMRSAARGGEPICATLVFVNADFAGLRDVLPGEGGAIYRKLEDRFGVSVADVEQEIRAMPMPPDSGKALACRKGVWAIRVLRRYRDSSRRLLLASVNFHPADRFFYAMHLQREQGRGWG